MTFNIFKLLSEILEELRIQNKLLAKVAGVSDEELSSFSLREVDFSTTEVIFSAKEEELLKEEDSEIENKIVDRVQIINKDSKNKQFFEEDELSDIREEINEA